VVTAAADVRPGVRRVEQAMGIPIVVDVRDDDVDPEALERMFAWLRWVDATFSTYSDDSELSRLNRGELGLDDVGPAVRWVLERCEELREQTRGYFDIRAASPTGLDPSGYVKGWSIDHAADILHAAGIHNFAVNAGGDLSLSGRAVPELAWRVGIQHPLQRDKIAAVVEANELAIATSGAYERGEHIVDPHSGRAPGGILSVTVVGPELGTADAYATAAFAMGGERAAHWTARLRGYEALTIMADERVLRTPGFPAAYLVRGAGIKPSPQEADCVPREAFSRPRAARLRRRRRGRRRRRFVVGRNHSGRDLERGGDLPQCAQLEAVLRADEPSLPEDLRLRHVRLSQRLRSRSHQERFDQDDLDEDRGLACVSELHDDRAAAEADRHAQRSVREDRRPLVRRPRRGHHLLSSSSETLSSTTHRS
jgi:FAD:protein FMN transferase